MSIVALFTQLFRAVATLLELRAVGERWRLAKEIQAYANEQEDKISRLRLSANNSDQLLADRLRDQLVALNGIASADRLSAPSADAPGREAGAN